MQRLGICYVFEMILVSYFETGLQRVKSQEARVKSQEPRSLH